MNNIIKRNSRRKGMEIITFILVLSAFLIYFPFTSGAEMYKWVDDKGELHISDTPPPAAKTSGEIKLYKDIEEDTTVTAPEPVRKREEPKPSVERRKNAEVVLYTTSWCPYCRKARDYLRSRGIDFSEYDIEKDKEAAVRKRQLDSTGGVPFAIINGRSIRGFSASAYERALTQ